MTDFVLERISDRNRMVDQQIAARGVHDRRVLEAFRTVPRELFVPEPLRPSAYEDRPLPLHEGQTIVEAYLTALMLEAAEIGPGDRILEIGTGSGYTTALLARLAGHVWSIECRTALADDARATLQRIGATNVTLVEGDGRHGLSEQAPFDVILIGAGGPAVPESLLEQLEDGGRLIMPLGAADQVLTKILRRAEGDRVDTLASVSFVPLISPDDAGRRRLAG